MDAAAATEQPHQLPLTVVVPFPPGGSLDLLARTLSGPLADGLGRSVVVQNIGGASGLVALRHFLNGPPDGHTVFLGSVAHLTLGLEEQQRRPQARRLLPLGKIGSTDYVLLASPKFEGHTLDDFVALARRHPGEISLAHPGNATIQYITALDLEARGGMQLLLVPFSGAAAMLSDLASGRVDTALVAVSAAIPMVRSGSSKLLGVLRETRHPILSRWPTTGSSRSLKGPFPENWAGLFALQGTPGVQIRHLKHALSVALGQPGLQKAILDLGSYPAGSDAEGNANDFEFLAWSEAKRVLAIQKSLDLARHPSGR